MTTAETEDLREAVLRVLYLRREAALRTQFVALKAAKETARPVTEQDAARELKFWADLGYVRSEFPLHSSLLVHTLTAAGITHCERNGIA